MASDLIARLQQAIVAENVSFVAAYLYGSEARETAGKDSDIDLAILFGTRPEPKLLAQPFALRDALTARLGRAVDLLTLDTAPPDLVHRVLRDGILIDERDRSGRIRFEVAARNAYFDIKPVLDQYRRSS